MDSGLQLEERVKAVLSAPHKITLSWLEELQYDDIELRSNGLAKKRFQHSLTEKEWYQLTGQLNLELIKGWIKNSQDLEWVLRKFSNRKKVKALMLTYRFDDLKMFMSSIQDLHFAEALPLDKKNSFLASLDNVFIKTLIKDSLDLSHFYYIKKYSMYHPINASFIASLDNDYLKTLALKNRRLFDLIPGCMLKCWHNFVDSWDADFFYKLTWQLSSEELESLSRLPLKDKYPILFLEKAIRDYLKKIDSAPKFNFHSLFYHDEAKILMHYLENIDALKNSRSFDKADRLALQLVDNPQVNPDLKKAVYTVFGCNSLADILEMRESSRFCKMETKALSASSLFNSGFCV